MAKFHFVEDYQKLVKSLIRNSATMDEAMSKAVGGDYDKVGQIERDILLYAGLKEGMSVVDYGCGSGRLAHALSSLFSIDYVGIDVVDELLSYAATKSASHYKFIKHHALNVPLESDSVNLVCAFSLFTHLLHHETFMYLEDMKRVLKKDGIIVFSFLEFALPGHWSVFTSTIETQKQSALPHLNMFIEKSVIEVWARHLGLTVVELIDGNDMKFNGNALGQSIAILRKS